MAYIQPNSIIEFFGDLSLSPTYENTLYFPNEAAKDNYFSGLTKLGTVSNCTYSRENRGFVRVELPMSRLIGATYMRFKNTSFENKWFYAFVTKVDYVNNLTTEVQFEVDKIMTWMGTFTLNEAYIERQHTLNDGIGNNIAEEGLSVGEYVTENYYPVSLGTDKIVMVYLENSQTVQGELVNGIYSGYKTEVFDVTPAEITRLNNILSSLVQRNLIDNVIGLYMCYSKITANGGMSEVVEHDKPYTSLNGYVPRNKKLFCYPYKYLLVDNTEGAQQEYMYEYFNTLPDVTSTGKFSFRVAGIMSSRAEVYLAPLDYKGKDGICYEERLGLSHFPMCAWGYNSYEAYLGQKNAYLEHDARVAQVPAGITGAMVGAGLGAMAGLSPSMIAGGALTGAAIGGARSYYTDIAQNMVENKIRPMSPAISRGDQGLDILYTLFVKTFWIYEKCITKNYAMMLDSYFDMFGYAVKQHGIPNMNARPNWTFVKTIGCSVGGNIPADDARDIEAIFDNGIRFWKNHNNIGNYSLNNAPE